ncbi:lycopene cyclase domain-containing protein [Candidatus Gottesmanbacteria bacterium]|nr:lycopene cyclase domain-containing protein [Candidatus Gottesmanbacteria bacterium]
MEYIFWLLVSSGIPLILIWVMYFNLLWRYRLTLILVVLLALFIHVPWDIYAVNSGLWSFPSNKNFGINVLSLPFEEYLYTTFIPLLGASITLVAKYKLQKRKN